MGKVLLVLFTGKKGMQLGPVPILNNTLPYDRKYTCHPKGLMQLLNNEQKYYVAMSQQTKMNHIPN